MMISNKNLSARDTLVNWHPYTQHKTTDIAIAIKKAEGVYLWDEEGKIYIDAISSWWVNPFGHCNQEIADAIYSQLQSLEHVLFSGFTHEPAVLLSEKLLFLLPKNQKKIFYSDNGSTAVEIALKAAIQFFYNKKISRKKIIAFENAFHGDTFGAMASSGISFFTEAFQGDLLQVQRIPIPVDGQEDEAVAKIKSLLQTEEYAAFIFEPLVQGAAGMKMYSSEALDQMIALCKEYKTFTIADEVMTGFGKTGKTFASDHLLQQPDMFCLSKALSGGTIPLAATSFSQEIYDGFFDEDVNKALFHGHTFTANPVGCAAALKSIEILEKPDIQENIKRIHRQHLAFSERILKHPKVSATRVLGVILALEIDGNEREAYYGSLRNFLYQNFIERGVVLRPVGNTVYVLPPYIISEDQLQTIYNTIEEVLNLLN